jgi:hypothetical protein
MKGFSCITFVPGRNVINTVGGDDYDQEQG